MNLMGIFVLVGCADVEVKEYEKALSYPPYSVMTFCADRCLDYLGGVPHKESGNPSNEYLESVHQCWQDAMGELRTYTNEK